MNDYYLDPPEPPDVPECCGDEMDVLDDGTCVCQKCGRRIEPQPDVEDPILEKIEHACATCGKPTDCVFCSPECTPDCPHGNRPGQCDACDYLADIAYDAARESRS